MESIPAWLAWNHNGHNTVEPPSSTVPCMTTKPFHHWQQIYACPLCYLNRNFPHLKKWYQNPHGQTTMYYCMMHTLVCVHILSESCMLNRFLKLKLTTSGCQIRLTCLHLPPNSVCKMLPHHLIYFSSNPKSWVHLQFPSNTFTHTSQQIFLQVTNNIPQEMRKLDHQSLSLAQNSLHCAPPVDPPGLGPQDSWETPCPNLQDLQLAESLNGLTSVSVSAKAHIESEVSSYLSPTVEQSDSICHLFVHGNLRIEHTQGLSIWPHKDAVS